MNTNEEVLNIVFKKNTNVEFEVSSDGVVTILEKQDHKIQRFFRKIGFKIPLYKKLSLDKFGSFVFINVDGKNTVEAIGELVEEEFGEESHPLYERLLLFLNYIDVECSYIEQ
ncbi:MAG: PqqD family peptide modification chaperone [Peptostreptococcus sp.]|uniref:hypothetical protein n=1 Tax=Peptostreptococcus sp. TaxID=1262 RepID=UPI002FC5F5B7